MGKLRAYLQLCRVSNLPTVWTNVLAAALLANGEISVLQYLQLTLAMSCLYLAGMSFNDVCDVEHDRRHRPDRPIPAGWVSLREARFLSFILFVSGLALLWPGLEPRGLAAAIPLVIAIVAYDLWHKDHPASVLIMALCRFLVFAVVAFALTGKFAVAAIVGGVVQFLYIVALSIVARYEGHHPFRFPLIPWLLAGISLVDGLLLAGLVAPIWLLAGILGAGLTRVGQRWFRGD
jgi:4-hydroxybenzoate polyprenyltransferase